LRQDCAPSSLAAVRKCARSGTIAALQETPAPDVPRSGSPSVFGSLKRAPPVPAADVPPGAQVRSRRIRRSIRVALETSWTSPYMALQPNSTEYNPKRRVGAACKILRPSTCPRRVLAGFPTNPAFPLVSGDPVSTGILRPLGLQNAPGRSQTLWFMEKAFRFPRGLMLISLSFPPNFIPFFVSRS